MGTRSLTVCRPATVISLLVSLLCPPSTLAAEGPRDSAVNQIQAARMLEKRGHTVEVVADGREAKELIRAVESG